MNVDTLRYLSRDRNRSLLVIAGQLDAMPIGMTLNSATLSITRTGDDSYNVEPAVNGRSYLSMMEVLDAVAS